MATISLYASRINQMPELLKTTMNHSVVFQNDLKELNKKILKIDNSACDVYNEAGIVQASVNTQEILSGSIGKLQNTVDEFITDTVNIDNNAAELINKNKNDFYEKYSYLKPTCEKNLWEKAKGSLSKAWEWCKKNWKIVVTAVLVIAAIAVLIFCPAAGLGLLALAAAKGILAGAVLGAAIGAAFSGLIAWRTGKPIWEAIKEGAIDGAMWGAIFGLVAGFGSLAGQILGKSCTALAKFEPLVNCAAKTLNGIDMALTGFDLTSFGAIMYDPECGWAKFYNKLSSNTFFNILQFGAGFGGTFAHGMKSGIKFDRDHGLSKCFVAGTLVSTFAGFRAIETIKAGDIVLSADEKTGEISYQKVVETYVRETMKLVHLRVNGEEIITTEGHPFYVRELGFVKASELAAGDLLTDSSGNDMPVESVHTEITNTPVTVYNFQVEKTHTYFVTESCVLVHNAKDYRQKLEQLKNDPDKFFSDNNLIMVDHAEGSYGNPGPKIISIEPVKSSLFGTNIYKLKLSDLLNPNEKPDCYYFPYKGETGHYSIPIKDIEKGTLFLTDAQNGCAVQINKISKKIGKDAYLEKYENSLKTSLSELEKQLIWETRVEQEKTAFFNKLENKYPTPLSDVEKQVLWEALIGENTVTEEHLLFTHDQNSKSIYKTIDDVVGDISLDYKKLSKENFYQKYRDYGITENQFGDKGFLEYSDLVRLRNNVTLEQKLRTENQGSLNTYIKQLKNEDHVIVDGNSIIPIDALTRYDYTFTNCLDRYDEHLPDEFIQGNPNKRDVPILPNKNSYIRPFLKDYDKPYSTPQFYTSLVATDNRTLKVNISPLSENPLTKEITPLKPNEGEPSYLSFEMHY